jgi:molecular chaperone DnaJ
MAPVKDLYEILGVPRDATAEDLKKAYRKLARELHPDVNPEPTSESRFKEVAGAYEILSDPEKRQRYDAFGSAGPAGQGITDIQDIFDMFFGGGFGTGFGGAGRRGQASRTRRGEDLGVRVSLSFKEAAFGVRRDLKIDRLVTCDRCLGNGAEPGTAPIACATCSGTGQVQAVRRSIFGTVMTASPCGTCRGTGMDIPNKCAACHGDGRVAQASTVTVDIPAGVSDGMELRVGDNGHAGTNGGPAGDLYVALIVDAAAAFERRGQDLYTVLDVSITQAALGAQIEIEGLDETEHIQIEPGTDSGTVTRIRGKGVPHLNRRGRGDLFVTIHVVTPDRLGRDERALLEKLAQMRGEKSAKDPARGELRRPQF